MLHIPLQYSIHETNRSWAGSLCSFSHRIASYEIIDAPQRAWWHWKLYCMYNHKWRRSIKLSSAPDPRVSKPPHTTRTSSQTRWLGNNFTCWGNEGDACSVGYSKVLQVHAWSLFHLAEGSFTAKPSLRSLFGFYSNLCENMAYVVNRLLSLGMVHIDQQHKSCKWQYPKRR